MSQNQQPPVQHELSEEDLLRVSGGVRVQMLRGTGGATSTKLGYALQNGMSQLQNAEQTRASAQKKLENADDDDIIVKI